MSYQTEPLSMWTDRRLVLRMSPIHGIGTFATHDIAAGELLIMVAGGIVFSSEEWTNGSVKLEAELYNEESLGDNMFIVTPKLFHYYVNHSCDSNIVDITRNPSSTLYVAVRPIRANEELTVDNYDPTTACACGSPRCRWSNPVQPAR